MATSIGDLVARIGADTRGLAMGLRKGTAQLKAFSAKTNVQMAGATAAVGRLNAGVIGLAASLGVGVGLGAAFTYVTKTGVDFEQSMTKAAAVMRATSRETEDLTAIARRMGETTEWTASQAAESLTFLGMAGFSAAKSIKALPGTLNLATAGGIDLGRAADIATNALTAMGLPVEQLNRVNDVFVGTITRSNVNMEMMAEAFKYAAPVARAYGYSIEELSGLIGMLGNAGIQGSMAGTQLAMAIQKSNEIAKEFGMTSSDLLDVLAELKRRGYDATEAMDMLGLRAGRAGGVLYELVDDTIALQKTLTETGGEAEDLADTVRNTLGGSFKELKSAIESLALKTFQTYRTDLKDVVDDTTGWIRENKNELVAYVEVVKESVEAVVEIFRWTGKALKTVYNTVMWPIEQLEKLFWKINNLLYYQLHPEQLAALDIVESVKIEVSDEELDAAIEKIRELKKEAEDMAPKMEAMGTVSSAFLGVPGGDLQGAVDQLKGIEDGLKGVGHQAKKVAGGIEDVDNATKKWAESIELVSDNMSTPDFFEAINQIVGDRRKAEIGVYEDILSSGKSTGEELERVWGKYAKLRMAQIQAEADDLRDLGVAEQVVADFVSSEYNKLNDDMKGVFGEQEGWLGDWAERVASSMQDAFQSFFFDAIMGNVVTLRDVLMSFVNDIARAVSQQLAAKTTTWILGSIPGLQHGGVVTSPTLAMVGESGPEAIVPLDKMGEGAFWENVSSRFSERDRGGSGEINVVMNVQTPNPSAFMESESLMAAQLQNAVNAARRNM